LTWVGFMELFVERFTPVYKKTCEEINLVQMRLTGPLKVYVLDLNAPMNVTPKMDKLAKNVIY
jgi:hypothetical protein